MSLHDLVRSGQLHRQPPTSEELGRLLAAAERSVADAALDGLSDEGRFDLAYKAVIQGALVALRSSGYRLASTVPGHHRSLLQTLAATIGADDAELQLLDTIRRRRNASDYSGRPVFEIPRLTFQ